MTDFQPGDQVEWFGSIGTVVGVINEPAVIVEWANGTRDTVAERMLQRP